MSTTSGSRDYARLDELAEEFAERYRRGERPSLQEYVDRLPEMAEEILELFPAMAKVEQADGDARGEACPPPPFAAPHLSQVGDYRILREIGRGGMGVVYEAEQISLGRRVALKVLPGHVAGDRKALERFRREAKAAARLHHTNIVPVFEVGQEGEFAFYAMQLIQGQGLDQVIDELARIRSPQRKPGGHATAGPEKPAAPVTATEVRVAASTSHRQHEIGRVAESLMTGRLVTEELESPATGPAGTERLDPNATSGHASVVTRKTTHWPRQPPMSRARRYCRAVSISRKSTPRRPSPALLPQRRVDRPPGGAGAGLRPCPRHRPPRHQAVEPAPG